MSDISTKVPTDQEIEILLLKNYYKDEEFELSNFLQKILEGRYEEVLNEALISLLRESLSDTEDLRKVIYESIKSDSSAQKSWFYVSIASLLCFAQHNWTGPQAENDIDWLKCRREDALKDLSLHDECNVSIKKPELLYLSKIIFSNEDLQCAFESCKWWLFRSLLLHQYVLNESSGVIFDQAEHLLTKIKGCNILSDDHCRTLFEIESGQFYFYYKRIQHSETCVDIAASITQLVLNLEGAMGKRTKYQNEEKAQLYLNVTKSKDNFPFKSCENLPRSLELNDDLRLERIQFSEEKESVPLGAVEEAIILAKYVQMQLSQPKDKLTDEEIKPYLTTVIDSTKNWSLKIASLYHRCLLESSDKRTIERSMMQMEYLIHELQSKKAPICRRMDLFFASGLKPVWMLEQMWANLMVSLGLVKGALDVFLKLELWEDVIACYNILELKHKAAEIIRQEIAKKPTVHLWCLLGDAEQDPSHYETAWKLSDEKSSRAQRHWGFFYYVKGNYKESIPHLKLSVELNNIQESVWLRLGFAALQAEDWKLAASAYRRYCALEQSAFEAWNNLAQAYIKLGDKPRAFKSLQDAIKCNFDRWQVWDNLMIVSIDLGYFSEVIRCYHRILDLKNHHLDIQILEILSRAIINDINDADGNSARQLLQKALELFGRISAGIPNNPDIWRMYGQLTALKKTDIDDQKAAQYLQHAHRAAVSNPLWCQQEETTENVLYLCIMLAEAYIHCSSESEISKKRSLLGSAKLSLQGVVKKVKDREWKSENILKALEVMENHLSTIITELEKIKLTD